MSATSPAACASRSRKIEEKSAMSRRNAAEVKNDCTSVWKALMRVAVSNAKSSALVLNSRGPLVTAKLWRYTRTLVLEFSSAHVERVECCNGR